jgi:hypothetical protein
VTPLTSVQKGGASRCRLISSLRTLI